MADYATKQDVQEIVDKAVNKVVEDLAGIIHDFSNQVAERFNSVDDQIAAMMRRLERGDDRITAIETMLRVIRSEIEELRHDSGVVKHPGVVARLDEMQHWIEQIARKTGVKLEQIV